MRKIFITLALVFSSCCHAAFTDDLLDRTNSCVRNGPFKQKAEIYGVIENLRNQNYYCEEGSDNLRVKFVATQGYIEHIMACALATGEISDLVGVIHTPMPATPLCTKPHPSIMEARDELLTESSRAEIVREYLRNGGRLFIAYPQGGLEKRTAEQQAIYREALNQFPGLLINYELDSLTDDQIGATYLFKDREGNLFAFSIKAFQVNDPRDNDEWGIWFGPLENCHVHERIEAITSYLQSVGGPTLR